MHRFFTTCRPLKQPLRRVVIACAMLGTSLPVRALDPGKPMGEYRRQTWQIDSGLPQNTVHAVLQTRDGFMWMATESGLVRFDGAEFRTFDTANTPEMHSNLVDDLFE